MSDNLMLFPSDVATHDLGRIAIEINTRHEQAGRDARSAVENARQAGELLVIAKAKVGHGMWTGWLRMNFKGSLTTATNYMRLAKSWPALEEANPQRIADLSYREAVKLTAKKPTAESVDKGSKVWTTAVFGAGRGSTAEPVPNGTQVEPKKKKALAHQCENCGSKKFDGDGACRMCCQPPPEQENASPDWPDAPPEICELAAQLAVMAEAVTHQVDCFADEVRGYRDERDAIGCHYNGGQAILQLVNNAANMLSEAIRRLENMAVPGANCNKVLRAQEVCSA